MKAIVLECILSVSFDSVYLGSNAGAPSNISGENISQQTDKYVKYILGSIVMHQSLSHRAAFSLVISAAIGHSVTAVTVEFLVGYRVIRVYHNIVA